MPLESIEPEDTVYHSRDLRNLNQTQNIQISQHQQWKKIFVGIFYFFDGSVRTKILRLTNSTWPRTIDLSINEGGHCVLCKQMNLQLIVIIKKCEENCNILEYIYILGCILKFILYYH